MAVPALYIDQDALGIARFLRVAGFSVITAHELGHGSYHDETHFLYAARHGLPLLTNNRKDFELLHRAWAEWGMSPAHAGILIGSQEVRPPVMAQALADFLRTDPLLTARLYRWTPGSGWRRYE